MTPEATYNSFGYSNVTSRPRSGADVVLADLPDRQSDLAALAGKVEELGRKAMPVGVDVRDKDSVNAAFQEVER